VFTVLAALSGMEREYIRDRTLEGHESARARGKTIGGAAVTDDAMLAVALHLRGQELSLREIAARLVIATGKKRASIPPRQPCCGCSVSTTRRPLPRRPPADSCAHAGRTRSGGERDQRRQPAFAGQFGDGAGAGGLGEAGQRRDAAARHCSQVPE